MPKNQPRPDESETVNTSEAVGGRASACKILLVDDEPGYRDSLGHILGYEKYEVRTAADARTALEIARQFQPDILVVDWMLRDTVNGIEVAERLLAVDGRMRTIFVTGYRTPSLEARMLEVPGARVLCKPFSLDDFLDAIRLAAGARSS